MSEKNKQERELQERKIKDFEVLTKLVNREVKLEDLDYDLKVRLIELCKERNAQIDLKIKEKEHEIEVIENFLKKIKS